jgi:carbonic anhydrase
MHTLKNIDKANITPSLALQLLKNGNFRFVNNLKVNRDLLELVNETKDDQFPFAAIVSCMDSRTSAEVVFDQGLGDIFSIRIAGNVINNDILGSLEYATAAVKTPLIVVLGHTGCGAIKGACDHVELGNLTSLLEKIQPAVQQEKKHTQRDGKNTQFVNEVAMLNVHHSVDRILAESTIINELVNNGKVGIIGAMYNVATGRVEFLEETIRMAQPQDMSMALAG